MKILLWLIIFTSYLNADECTSIALFRLKHGETPALDALMKQLSKETKSNRHHLIIKDGEATLKIGLLQREQSTNNRLMLKAIKEGSISKIDAGFIEGPKALIVINSILSLASKSSKNISVSGQINLEGLLTFYEVQKTLHSSNLAEKWSSSEIIDFEKTIKNLELDKCLKTANTSECHFLFKIQNGRMIRQIY